MTEFRAGVRYMDVRQTAERLGLGVARVGQLIARGDLEGAVPVGGDPESGRPAMWLVPEDSWPEWGGKGRPPLWLRAVERERSKKDKRFTPSEN